MTRDEKIDIFWSEREIRRLVHNSCRGADRCDPSLLESIYHADAIDEHGINPTNTAREYLDYMPVHRPHLEALQHHATNHVIAINGDYAEGEAYVFAYHRYKEGGVSTIVAVGGRYLDKYERRDGVWKIAHRVCMEDWSVKVPAPPARKEELAGVLERGGIGEADLSYQFFKFLGRPSTVTFGEVDF